MDTIFYLKGPYIKIIERFVLSYFDVKSVLVNGSVPVMIVEIVKGCYSLSIS